MDVAAKRVIRAPKDLVAGYVMDVERFEPPDLIELRSVQAPVPMRVTYEFQPHPEGTLTTVTMSTADGRMARLAGPLMRALLQATVDGEPL